jgi:hypothetical protein
MVPYMLAVNRISDVQQEVNEQQPFRSGVAKELVSFAPAD